MFKKIIVLLVLLFINSPLHVAADQSVHKAIKKEAIKFNAEPELAQQISNEIIKISEKEKVDPIVIAAIISVESSYNPQSHSKAGALGLMQVVPRYHPDVLNKLSISSDDLFEVNTGIKAGVIIFKKMLNKHNGDVSKALQSYNGTLSDKNKSYSKKVMKRYYIIKSRI